jgi:hypothetical protein
MRHSVHHVPIQIGWMMMKKIDTTPSGTIITPNRAARSSRRTAGRAMASCASAAASRSRR